MTDQDAGGVFGVAYAAADLLEGAEEIVQSRIEFVEGFEEGYSGDTIGHDVAGELLDGPIFIRVWRCTGLRLTARSPRVVRKVCREPVIAVISAPDRLMLARSCDIAVRELTKKVTDVKIIGYCC
jgi:hypothetical protein